MYRDLLAGPITFWTSVVAPVLCEVTPSCPVIKFLQLETELLVK